MNQVEKEAFTKSNKTKAWMKRHPILTGFGILIILIIIFSGGSDSTTNTTESVVSSKKEEVTQEPVIKVTAVKLASDYEANEVAADAQYKNNVLEVTGTIKNIGKDILDTPYVALSDGIEYSITSVQCMFDKSDQDKLTTLQKDTKITLKGRSSGKLGNIILQQCEIVENL